VPVVAENGTLRQVKEAFYRLLSIPERAAQGMIDEDSRARAAGEDGEGYAAADSQPEEC